MPRLVTASHPSEADLLNLAAGRQAEGLEECRRHLETGCRLCEVRLSELAELVESVREEEAFNAILEADDLPAVPEFGGQKLEFRKPAPQLEDIYRLAQSAERLAEGILAAARAGDAELDAALRALYGNPARGFTLLYACQKGNAFVVQDPLRARELARAVFEEAKSLMDASTEARLATPAPRETVQAEAKLLESQAQNQLGYAVEARIAAADAREFFRASGDVGFGFALADYYEGSAASFAKDYVAGERLLKKALKVFAEFGQDNLMARAQGMLGLLYLHRGDETRALTYFDHAIGLFDPIEDARFLTGSLINRALALLRLRRLDEARPTYARALSLVRKHQLTSYLGAIRSGLAQVDIQCQEYGRALRAFQELSREERAAGWTQQAFISDLYVAECLGRLGRDEQMAEAIISLRIQRRTSPFSASPAMEELFSCLDQGALNADLVAHVRAYLQEEANGTQREYRPLRIAS